MGCRLVSLMIEFESIDFLNRTILLSPGYVISYRCFPVSKRSVLTALLKLSIMYTSICLPLITCAGINPKKLCDFILLSIRTPFALSPDDEIIVIDALDSLMSIVLDGDSL